MAKGFTEALADDVTTELAGEGLQSDERYADAYVRQRSARGFGPRRIRQELRQRGVADAQVERSLASCELDWEACARSVRSKKFARLPDDIRERSRQVRFLEYRGFFDEQVRAAFTDEQP